MNKFLSDITTARRRQFHGPQEVGHFLEVRSDSEYFVNDIFNAFYSKITKRGLHYFIGTQRNSLTGEFAISTLVNKVADAFQVGISVGQVRLHESKQLDRGGIDSDENSIVDLTETEELQDFPDFGRNSIDTSNTNNKEQLLFRSNIDLVIGLGLSSLVDGIALKLKYCSVNTPMEHKRR